VLEEVRVAGAYAQRLGPALQLQVELAGDRAAHAVHGVHVDDDAAMDMETGFHLIAESQAPAGAGLGGSSALAIACIGALNRLV